MRQVVRLRRNADDTLTVRIGRYIEHIGVDGKTKAQVYDAVKYACISKGVLLNQINLTELLDKALHERS